MKISPSLQRAYEFACHSAACRPPTSGGTGGSTKAGVYRGKMTDAELRDAVEQQGIKYRRGQMDTLLEATGQPTNVVDAIRSSHYKRRGPEVMPLTEAEGLALVRDNDATGRRILDKGHELTEGQPVGVRANLNVKKTTGVTVQTVHEGTERQLKNRTGMFSGEAVGYTVAATLRDVNLSVNQQARYRIASKQANKYPMASVDGHFTSKTGGDKFDGVELKFNPMKQHVFVDPDGRAVKHVEEATVVGSSVFARGKITYYTPDDLPKVLGDVPSDAHA